MGHVPGAAPRAVETARAVTRARILHQAKSRQRTHLGELVDLPGETLTKRLAGSRRAENNLCYERLRLVAALWQTWWPDDTERAADRRAGRRDVSREALRGDLVVTEVAAALGLSEYAAAQRVDAAVALLVDRRLPLADALCADGDLDWARLQALLSRTRDLSVEQAQVVEEQVLAPAVRSLTIGRFMEAVDRAVLAVDPAAAARRRTDTVEGRRVSFFKDRDGFDGASGRATLSATGPADALVAAMACIDAAARWLRAHGDPRSLDQLRHDLLVTGCTTGALPVPQDVLPVSRVTPDWAAAARAASAATSGSGPGSGAGSVTRSGTEGVGSGSGRAEGRDAGDDSPRSAGPGAAPHTEAGTGGAPGLRPAARQTVAVLPRTGADAVVRTSPRPQMRAEIVVLVPAATLAGLNDHPAHLQGYGPITADMARDLARDGIWRCAAVDDTHATIIGVGRTTWTPGYVPGKALRDFMAIAALTCTVPWCTIPTQHCDLDHRTPYTSGGATCSCQVTPLCRTHHRQKTAGDLTLQASTDPAHPHGTVILTTKGGQRFTVMPHAPLPPEAYLVDATPSGAPGEDSGVTDSGPSAAPAQDAPPF